MPVDKREKIAYLNATPAQREIVLRGLTQVLSLLRAQSLSYQTSHWQAEGDSAYGDHLLFERLYGSVLGEIDQLAEKSVGYLGAEAVSLVPQIDEISNYCRDWVEEGCPFKRGLLTEKQLQLTLKSCYENIKRAGAMTLGLDDWLMACANSHETNTYLLQQALAGKRITVAQVVAPVAPGAKKLFFDNPEKREVTEFYRGKELSNLTSNVPPTPTEILEEPGGDQVSTLNRYVVDSEEPGVPPSLHMSSWLEELDNPPLNSKVE